MSVSPSLAPLIGESERVLGEAISYFGLQVRPSQIVVTIQNAGRFKAYGWFSANRWKNGKPDALHEINLSAEHLKEADIGEVLLHELAHAENKQLNVKDCSGQRHNKNFKRMAERLGLEVEEPDDSCGYGITALGFVASEFLRNIAFKRELFSLCRLGAAPVKEAPGSRLVKWECPDCGYTMRITRKWLTRSEPKCPCCDDTPASVKTGSESDDMPRPAEIEAATAPQDMTENQIKERFRKAAKELQDCVISARKLWPRAELYLSSGTLHLMSGPHHEGVGEKARIDRVMESFRIPEMDGGDW